MSTDRDLWPLYEYQSLVICNTAFSLRSPRSAHQWVQRSQWWQQAPHCESVAHLTKTTAADLLTNFQEQNWGSGLRLRKQKQGHQMTFEITLSFHPFQMHGEGKLGETNPVFLAMESCLTLAETNYLFFTSQHYHAFAKFMKLPIWKTKKRKWSRTDIVIQNETAITFLPYFTNIV